MVSSDQNTPKSHNTTVILNSTSARSSHRDLIPFYVAGCITFLLLASGWMVFNQLSNLPQVPAGFEAIDKLGSYMAGLFSFIGVIWICATFYMQIRELSLQRQELLLQRQASQSAAASFRAQMIISLHDRALSALSDSIRDLCHLLDNDAAELQFADQLSRSGNNRVYFEYALDSNLVGKIKSSMEKNEISVGYLVRTFCREAQKLQAMLTEQDTPQR